MMFLRKMLGLPEPEEPQGLFAGAARDFGIPIPQNAPSADGSLFADAARTLGLVPQPSLYMPDFQPYPGSLGGVSALRLLGSSGALFESADQHPLGDLTGPSLQPSDVASAANSGSEISSDGQTAMTSSARQILYDHFGGPEAAQTAFTTMLMKMTNGALSAEQAASVYRQMLDNLYDTQAYSLRSIPQENGVFRMTQRQIDIIKGQIEQLDSEDLRKAVGDGFAAAMRDGKVVCTNCRQ